MILTPACWSDPIFVLYPGCLGYFSVWGFGLWGFLSMRTTANNTILLVKTAFGIYLETLISPKPKSNQRSIIGRQTCLGNKTIIPPFQFYPITSNGDGLAPLPTNRGQLQSPKIKNLKMYRFCQTHGLYRGNWPCLV